MDEKISIRRQAKGVMVNVTRTDGRNTVHEQQRVFGPTVNNIAEAIRACRKQCDVLLAGIASVNELQEAA